MAKGMMIVDGQRVNFDGEKNVLSVIRKAGIEMPTFCYYSDLSVYGACRMCVVEDEKTGKIDASCSMEPRDGMRISTNSARLLKHRRVILELLLASHNCNCTTCEKSGHCRLQELAQQLRCAQNSLPRYARALRDRQLVARGRCATRTSASSAATACACARRCRAWALLNFAYRGSNLQVMPAFDQQARRDEVRRAAASARRCAPPAPSR